MFPPEMQIPTLFPARVSRSASRPASPVAPAPSARLWVVRSSSRKASAIAASLTFTNPASPSRSAGKVRSYTVRVASPSANVLAEEPLRGRAGDHLAVIGRVHQRHPALAHQALRDLRRGVVVIALLDQLRAETAHRLVLLRVVWPRHAEDDVNAEQLPGPGEALPVIAAGRGDHSALLLLRAERGERRQRVARLERLRGLVVLVLDEDADPVTHRLVERRIATQRSRRQPLADPLPRFEHVAYRHGPHGGRTLVPRRRADHRGAAGQPARPRAALVRSHSPR